VIAKTSSEAGSPTPTYDIKWGTVSGTRSNTISGVTPPYTHTGRTNGTPYYYSMVATNTVGSTESNEVSGIPNPVNYTDSFTDADNMALATHNALWASPGSTYLVTGFKISSNAVQTTGTFTTAGAYHTSSVSDTSQIVNKALSNTAQTVNKYVAVRMGSATLGYAGRVTLSGGNWTTAAFSKNGGGLGSSCSGLSYAAGSDHTMKIVASGTSTVSLTLYIDGTSVCSTTDSTSTITSGHPGFYVAGNGTVLNNVFDSWQDN
jgi:hypothetical protein